MSTTSFESGKQPERKTVFDPADRARLRAALIGYMRENDIGVPTLIAHMARVVGRDIDQIPQKTLQRFLAGSHRTNDGFLTPIEQFVRTIPAPPPATLLGEAMAGFFGCREASELSTSSLPALSGTFAVMAEYTLSSGFGPAMRLSSKFGLPVSDVTFRPVPGHGFAHAHEFLFNQGQLRDGPADAQGRRDSAEGIALAFGPLVYVFLKSGLTRRPRTYWLAAEGETLTGYATEFEGVIGAIPPGAPLASTRLQFQRRSSATDHDTARAS